MVYLVLIGLSLIYGRLFMKLAPLSFKASYGLSIQFLFGYLLLNTLLFLLFLFTPLGIATNVVIIGGGGVVIWFSVPGIAKDNRTQPAAYVPDFLCLLLSGIAATLWCADILGTVVSDGPNTVYPIFVDGFFHVRAVSSFAQAHGLTTLSDMRMSGHRIPFYHIAMYATPAAVFYCTNSSGYVTFVSFLVPFGIFLTGLAAFSLGGLVWGRWPGVGATLAVVLLPDAYQQGFGNKFMSYQLLQQAAPGGLYGTACIVIAWIFILDSCKTGRFASILFGYSTLMLSIAYKAHFFVANAFLLMIYPCIFFPGVRARWRIISAVALVSLFCFVVTLSQRVDSVPTLRLDGSGGLFYAKLMVTTSGPGSFKSFFQSVFTAPQESKALLIFCIVCFFVLSTFGLWTAALVVVSFLRKTKIGASAFFFPFLVIVNYLVMSVGLAPDSKGVARPEELLHRPFVWAYFVVAAWTGAALYTLLFGSGPPGSKPACILGAIFALLSFSVPLAFARNLQTLPPVKGLESYKTFNSVPSALVQASLYICNHSRVADIIQDSEDDPRFVVTALAERQSFAAGNESQDKAGYRRPRIWSAVLPNGLRERFDELAACKRIADETTLTQFMQKHRISWYILEPNSDVAWPASFLEKAVFFRDGCRVFHFPR
jgi:hypothetical protein